MKIAVGQINPIIGDIDYNIKKMLENIKAAKEQKADLIVFPELSMSGYPPKDLLLSNEFIENISQAIKQLLPYSKDIGIVIGAPTACKDGLANTCILLAKGEILAAQNKTLLPNYDVFDENRYFIPANTRKLVEFNGQKIALTICEDIWNDKDYWNRQRYDFDPVEDLVSQGADLIINISASPYHVGKQAQREDMLVSLATKYRKPIIYVNQIGGNDDLVFDGNSLFIENNGEIVHRGKAFTEDLFIIELNQTKSDVQYKQEGVEEIYNALVLGIKDYLYKTGFKKAIIGLSGGIDSAVTAALATHALGKENVFGVAMPSQYSSEGSIVDAQDLALNLGINFEIVPIKEMFYSYIAQLNAQETLLQDLAEENLQARIRGNILMFKSNREGALLLSTGNKSEMAVGYTTLYGDMCGGLAVISDVPKSTVYKLAEFINKNKTLIPENTIVKPPSAELRPDQKDQDSLPPYDVLDAILKAYIEDNKSLGEITVMGYDEQLVQKILTQVDRNEYKRRQAPPGIRVTTKAFGVGRRMPIAQGWRHKID